MEKTHKETKFSQQTVLTKHNLQNYDKTTANKSKFSQKTLRTHLPPHEIVNAERQIADRPLAQSLRVREPERLRQRRDRLEERRWSLSWPPSDSLSTRSRQISAAAPPITPVFVDLRRRRRQRRQPPAQHVVEQHRSSGGGRHCPRRHGNSTAEIGKKRKTSSQKYQITQLKNLKEKINF